MWTLRRERCKRERTRKEGRDGKTHFDNQISAVIVKVEVLARWTKECRIMNDTRSILQSQTQIESILQEVEIVKSELMFLNALAIALLISLLNLPISPYHHRHAIPHPLAYTTATTSNANTVSPSPDHRAACSRLPATHIPHLLYISSAPT